ncbi:sugar phosphate isomerase/epimerase family protein [Paenibacillus endoradicis]|uniref:sugar phosphate isomerase/epimerase family protein n=1 Tax=Paenibacillus endoradicis TaxID=2972487 RepID=UPI002158D89C|nr:sugar phosphate isomerase/epimerase [Paenibacillus endoradicis]MCR8660399.1 sugar phosphate isomerase/epimerase [Paenibacillus endoradicis]
MMKLALAMYTVYGELQKNLEQTLSTIKKMGYQGVEFYGETRWSAVEVKRLLEVNELEICGWHVEWKLLQSDTIAETLLYHKELGNPNIIIPCLGGPWNVAHTAEENNKDTWLAHAKKMNEIAEQVEAEGMTLGYHTHAHEFEDDFDGITPWNILLEHTKKTIFLELDTGNCLEAHYDPVKAIQEASGRIKVVHAKPYSLEGGIETAVASPVDLNPWISIIDHCHNEHCQWLAIENEAETLGNKLEVAERDLKSIQLVMKRMTPLSKTE